MVDGMGVLLVVAFWVAACDNGRVFWTEVEMIACN